MQNHVLSVLVQNHHGVLSRISGMFAARGFNIDSLTVGPTHDPAISRMTVALKGDSAIIDQLEKQLNKVTEVIVVKQLSQSAAFVDRELVLVKVKATAEKRSEIMEIINIFRAKTVDITPTTMTIEVTGTQDKLNTMLSMVESYGILEIARTGIVGLMRGPEGMHANALAEQKH
ncbi:MAG: acetolactate synthase small subunit [Candidatus Sumerlaeia bacterium]|nr:acetolactate synthase small subunit [Candidatus Sumerlaeia bacterium]